MREINTESFESEVLQSSSPVIVDFWAPWCSPCKALTPVMKELSAENRDIQVFDINVDENPDLAVKYAISSIPAILVFQNGEVVDRLIGLHKKADYQSSINGLRKVARCENL